MPESSKTCASSIYLFWPRIAALIISLIPAVTINLLMQKPFVVGLMVDAVKG